MSEPDIRQWQEIDALWTAGSPIAAMKRFREITGLDLAQTRAILESRLAPPSATAALPPPVAALLQSGHSSGDYCATWTTSSGDHCVLLQQPSATAPWGIYVFPWPIGHWGHQLNVVRLDLRQWQAHLASGLAPDGADWTESTLSALRQRFANTPAMAARVRPDLGRTSLFRLDQRRFEQHWLWLSNRVAGEHWRALLERGVELDDWQERRGGLSAVADEVPLTGTDEQLCLRLCLHECQFGAFAVAQSDRTAQRCASRRSSASSRCVSNSLSACSFL